MIPTASQAQLERLAASLRPADRTAVVPPEEITAYDRAAWNELLHDAPDSAPFVDDVWVSAWTGAFRPAEPLFACDWEGGRLAGIGALHGLRESWGGRSVSVLQSLTNPESPRFEFLTPRGRGDVQHRLWRALCSASRWDVLRMEFLPRESPTLGAGERVADELGWGCVVEETFASPWRRLAATAWDQGLDRKFKSNLRNRERRLQELGDVTWRVVQAETELPAAVERFCTIEASGWKGERGTAIASRAAARAFYDGLRERTTHGLWVTLLSVGGRTAAAQLVRVHDRTVFLLKTAYDPAFAPFAPGQLITARLMRYAIEHGMDVFDFLGEDMPWKRDWEPEVRPHYRITLFAPTARGRYAYWIRYGLKESVKRIPGAVRGVRWLRSRLHSA